MKNKKKSNNMNEMDTQLKSELPEPLSDPKTVTIESLCRNARSFASIIHPGIMM